MLAPSTSMSGAPTTAPSQRESFEEAFPSLICLLDLGLPLSAADGSELTTPEDCNPDEYTTFLVGADPDDTRTARERVEPVPSLLDD